MTKDSSSTDAITKVMAFIKNRTYKLCFLYLYLFKPLLEKAWEGPLRGWAQDIPSVQAPEVWLKRCESVLKYLPSASLQETHLKILNRAYITQSQSNHMVPEETGRCQKCGVSDATFFHNFWEHNKIWWFWDKLIWHINTIFSLQLVKHPNPCIFLNLSEWDLGVNSRGILPILIIILSIAKQCIMSQWIHKSPPPPPSFCTRCVQDY